MANSDLVINMIAPHFSDGFQARNNPFQRRGPKGFVETKTLPNNGVYVRIDLPGVDEENLTYNLDQDKKIVLVIGEEPIISPHEDNPRSFCAAFGLVCKCCEISNIKAVLRDGVLTFVLQKSRFDSKSIPCEGEQQPTVAFKDSTITTPDGNGRAIEENPYVLKGSKKSYETKPTEDGCLFVRVDIPGVAKEDLDLSLENGEVRFFGKTTGFLGLMDTGSREYVGAVSPFPPTSSIEGEIEYEIKNGVLRMKVPPPV